MKYLMLVHLIAIVFLVSCGSHKELKEKTVNKAGIEQFTTGMEAYRLREFNVAVSCFNNAVENGYKEHDVYFYRALAKEKLNDMDGSMKDLDEAIRLNSSAMYYNNRAMLHAINGNARNAFMDYESAIRIDSTFSLAWFNKGIAHHYQDQSDSACYCMRKALELGDSDAQQYLKEHCNL